MTYWKYSQARWRSIKISFDHKEERFSV